jgi:hypothetical protein
MPVGTVKKILAQAEYSINDVGERIIDVILSSDILLLPL